MPGARNMPRRLMGVVVAISAGLLLIPVAGNATIRSNGVIAYTHFAPSLNRFTVRTVDPITGVRTTIVRGTSPAWSPSGRRLAYVTPADFVAIRNFNGSITHTGVPASGAEIDGDADMAWSPDGASLAYGYTTEPNSSSSDHIWVMNIHRPYQPRQLSTNAGRWPSWSPDSARIVYGGYGSDLWMVNADGTHDADLTNTPRIAESRPDWSPDGNSLAYLGYSEQQAGLFVATVNGGNAHLITAAAVAVAAPDWSPDGTQIAFIGDNGAVEGVATIDSDGSGLRVITRTPQDYQPDWQPAVTQ